MDVSDGDVTEDAAHQDDMGRDRARVGISNPGVGPQQLDPAQPSCLRRMSPSCDVALVELDQPGAYVVAARMSLQNADYIPTLAGAQADQSNAPGGSIIEFSAQVLLDEFQPPRGQGTWIVVVPVPFHPVTPRVHLRSSRGCGQATSRRSGKTHYGVIEPPRNSSGTYLWSVGPVYSAIGLIILLLEYCSMMWASQPGVLPTAKNGVKR